MSTGGKKPDYDLGQKLGVVQIMGSALGSRSSSDEDEGWGEVQEKVRAGTNKQTHKQTFPVSVTL